MILTLCWKLNAKYIHMILLESMEELGSKLTFGEFPFFWDTLYFIKGEK